MGKAQMKNKITTTVVLNYQLTTTENKDPVCSFTLYLKSQTLSFVIKIFKRQRCKND